MQEQMAYLRLRLQRDDAVGHLLRVVSHPYALLAFACLAAWWPRGFNIGPVNDCWFQLAAVTSDGGYLRDNILRTFGAIPLWLGIHLGSGGFQGAQVVMLVMAWLRGALFLEIMRRLLPDRPLTALAAGFIAMFPFSDNSYFWLGASGLQFSLVMALAACLCALVYLERPYRAMLYASIMFQLLAAFTYPGFLPLMIALPLGAWWLRRMDGLPANRWYPLAISLTVCVAGFVTLLVLHHGGDRNARVLDISVARAMAGYAWAVHRLLHAVGAIYAHAKNIVWLPALACALYAAAASLPLLTLRRRPAGRRFEWRRPVWLLAGLLLLAVLSYFPYSIANVRFQPSRALLGASIFANTAALIVLFLSFERFRLPKLVPVLALAVIAMTVVVNGIEARETWVRGYRNEEKLLSAVATAVRQPAPGTFLLVRLAHAHAGREVAGFYNRELAFTYALRYMYGDQTLSGGFFGFKGDAITLQRSGVRPRHQGANLVTGRKSVDYQYVMALDYDDKKGTARIIQDFPGRKPEVAEGDAEMKTVQNIQKKLAVMPSVPARTCRMLEARYRPAYCDGQ